MNIFAGRVLAAINRTKRLLLAFPTGGPLFLSPGPSLKPATTTRQSRTRLIGLTVENCVHLTHTRAGGILYHEQIFTTR